MNESQATRMSVTEACRAADSPVLSESRILLVSRSTYMQILLCNEFEEDTV